MTTQAPGTTVTAPRRRPWLPLAIVLGVLVVLVALFFLADTIVRGVAQQRVQSEIEQHLPSNVRADVDVSIGGASVIAQYLTGSFEEVRLSAPKTTVDGIPLNVEVTAKGVPVDQTKTIQDVRATIALDATATQQVANAAGLSGTITLGTDAIGYADELRVLGLTVPYDFEVQPTASADRVTLTPTSVNVDTGAFGVVDLSGAATALLQNDPPSICVAQYLPKGTVLDELVVTPSKATAKLSSTSLRLDAASLQDLGTCS
jgi:hypothetical protein